MCIRDSVRAPVLKGVRQAMIKPLVAGTRVRARDSAGKVKQDPMIALLKWVVLEDLGFELLGFRT